VQERELFDFFVNGLSVIESCLFGLYAIGSVLDRANFKLTNQKEVASITRKKVIDAFQLVFPEETLTSVMNKTIESEEFRAWKDIRNVLAHQSTPGRVFYMPGALTLWKLNNIPIDSNIAVSNRQWLAKAISEILWEADSFSRRHFQKST